MAVEIAKKARWYQVTTLSKRVSAISRPSVANAMRKVPP